MTDPVANMMGALAAIPVVTGCAERDRDRGLKAPSVTSRVTLVPRRGVTMSVTSDLSRSKALQNQDYWPLKPERDNGRDVPVHAVCHAQCGRGVTNSSCHAPRRCAPQLVGAHGRVRKSPAYLALGWPIVLLIKMSLPLAAAWTGFHKLDLCGSQVWRQRAQAKDPAWQPASPWLGRTLQPQQET